MEQLGSRNGLGGNHPPIITVEELMELLKFNNEQIITRQRELIAALDRVPETCDNDDTAARLTDFIKSITNCKKSLEGKRVDHKEPFLTLERSVDGFFKPMTEALDKGKLKLERTLGAWLQKKAEEERRRRREEEERLRKEAEEKARIAAEAEAERIRREREAQEAAEAQMPKLAESNQEAANVAGQEAAKAIDEAVIAEQQANKAAQDATARPAKLASVHGAYGSRSSLRTKKIARVQDMETVRSMLGILGPHFTADHIQVALNSFMAANWKDDSAPPKFAGVVFEIETLAQVR